MQYLIKSETAHPLAKIAGKLGIALLAATVVSGCNTLSRLSDIGETPELTEIKNPTHEPNYRPISMPMPAPETARRNANSLWRPGSRAFLKDLRANRVGDIVTVLISIDDKAELDNETTRTRASSEDVDVPGLLGYQDSLGAILPEAATPDNLLNLGSTSSQAGTGAIDRKEKVELSLAAVVTQVLPNGNLVIHGRQETRVNYEVRELQLAGVIRPQDIDNSNEISYDKIAEARLAYGGRGQINDVQQPRWGSQFIDILMPF